jgi:hypothetical protein
VSSRDWIEAAGVDGGAHRHGAGVGVGSRT